MKKKILAFALVFGLSLSLFGCSSVGLATDNLMHPPKATGDKAEIQSIIDAEAGDDYILKYPQNGSYRSAITMKDIDSDSVEEAVAFYLPAGDIATVHMLVMDRIDNQWQSVGKVKSQSTGIDSLSFCDLDGNGIYEIVTCWKTYNSSINQLSVCIYEENTVREVGCDFTCSSMLAGDFYEKEGDELLLLTLFSTEREASSSLVTINDTKSDMISVGTSPLDRDVVSYAQLSTGNIFENQFGAVIDGCTATGQYSTQLLYYNTYFNSLERITFTENVAYNQALRSYPVMSEDIDSDSVIEIPAAFKLKIEEDRTDVVAAAIIYWCQQTLEGTVHLDKTQAASFSYSFTFDIPKSWEDKFTAFTNHAEGEVTFYKWEKNKATDKLLTVKMFDINSNEETLAEYTELLRNDSFIYTFKSYANDASMLISDEEIISAFNLM